jgi:acyl-CoA thioesterase-1
MVVFALGTALADEPAKPRWNYAQKLLRPVWQGNTVEGESALFIRDPKTGEAKASVLFPVLKIMSVRNSAGNVTYEEGRDYQWKPESREITLPANSRIISHTPAELRRPAGSQKYKLTHRDGNGEILFGSKLEYHSMQTCITYTHVSEDWKSRVPTFNEHALPRTIQKLRNHKPISIVLIGDSISSGCNASGWAGEAPFQPSFPGLLQQHLEAQYQTKVRVTNPSVSGKDTRWALSAIDTIVEPQPDLVIVAFGMNDAAGRSAKEYQANIKAVMAKIREKLPDTEFIVVASMLGNRNWTTLKHELFPQYRDALAELCEPGIALADMTSLWTEFLKRKQDWDLTGNGVNHPNDFGHRVYAQVLSTLLVPTRQSTQTRRVLYNFDGDSCLSTKAGSKGPVPVNIDDVKRLIEEVAYDGSRVDTVLVCINAQVMYYPTKVGTMRGTLSTPNERAKWSESEQQRFKNLKAFFDTGVDPYAVMLAEAKKRGCEALLTFRMNDDHGTDFLRTQFLVDHADWRLGTKQYQGSGAMDFAREEVRDYTFHLIEEAVERYDCDGIELDFNRFPRFFKDGSTDQRVAKMNSLVRRVRKMLDEVGRRRGRSLVLSVRPPSNFGSTPPTPDSARKLGCDVPAWVKHGWVDFVAVSEFLHQRGDLPIDKWKQAITTVPVYGGIECTKGGGAKNLNANEYRHAATQLIKAGADGVYLFNFFTSRERGKAAYEPPFEVLRDLSVKKESEQTAALRPSGWQPLEVRQLAGEASSVRLPARFQIVTESWNRVVAVPYMVNMPEKERLLMLVGCDYPHRAFALTSDDRGATWTEPRPVRIGDDGKASIGMGTSLAYLGKGKLVFYETGSVGTGHPARWFSADYGRTWGDPVAIAPMSDENRWRIWDAPLVDHHPKTGKITRLAETGYAQSGTNSQAYIRFSTDEGQMWSQSNKVPQWQGANEALLFRAGNGDLLAACRTDVPRRLKGKTLDHYEGLGISISKDDGGTWSAVKKLYDYGRHHPSLVLMPNQDIVMTYVTRLGYVDDQNGFPQFGIEAVVSHDHGVTWDLDHRYLLHVWSGKRKGETYWWPSSQATSSTLLPDGAILTAFGTGYRIKAGQDSPQAPRDAGLIEWRLNTKPVNAESRIRDAAFDSDLRNVFDPKE